MTNFNERFRLVKEKIQKDKNLISKIFSFLEDLSLIPSTSLDGYYFLEVNKPFPLGIDPSRRHISFFEEILSKMRILHEESNGEIDLPKAYFLLESRKGILSEDLTCNYHRAVFSFNFYSNLNSVLKKVFQNDPFWLERSTFQIKGKNYERFPVIDLDHLQVKREYQKIFKEYLEYYKKHEDFLIKRDNLKN